MWILILAAAMMGEGKPAAPAGPVKVSLDTSKGEIVLELYPDKAPGTVANFVQYVKAGHYDGTIFHRVIPDFMIQGGGFTAEMSEKPTRGSIQNESANGLVNSRGTIAMARTPAPHSASAQWFINLKDNSFLDKKNAQDGWGYAVFGKVVSGMSVVDAIAGVATVSKGMHQNVPREAVVIRKARLLP